MKFPQELFNTQRQMRPHYRLEDSFRRVFLVHFVGAFIISPVIFLLSYYAQVSPVYQYMSISYTIMFPLYGLLCWKVEYLRDKLIIFYYFHYFAITLLTFYQVYNSGFRYEEFLIFLAVYALGAISIVRIYPALLYLIFTFLLLSFSFVTLNSFPLPKSFVIAIFFTIGASALIVSYARSRTIHDIKEYAEYLKRIMNNSGAGYIMADLQEVLKILDFNQEACRVLNIKESEAEAVEKTLLSQFSGAELDKIRSLKLGARFKKDIQYTKFGIRHHVEIHVNPMTHRQNTTLLFRIVDVTDSVHKREELELSEKKYRNLYYRNRAGVFTINRNSVIIDGNSAFFEMFENTIAVGDCLFADAFSKDWEIILESFGEKEVAQNYQTQFVLNNGTEKTFIFSWYLDTRSQNIEGSVIDLTSIQKASQALKQSEEKYRLIFEESNDAILLLETDKIVELNRKTMQLFGLPQKDLLNMNLFDLSANRDQTTQDEYEINKGKLNNARSIKFNWLFTGHNRIIEAEVTMIEIMLGNNLFYQCVIHDSTEQNKNLRAIRKNQRNMENILENTPEGFLIVRNNEFLYKNPEIEKLVGTEVDFNGLFTETDQKRFLRAYERHLEERTIQNLQLTLLNQNQEELLMDVTIVSTIFEEEDASLIIIKDVSVQNALAKEMLRAELAEENNKKLAKEIMERIRAEKQLEAQFIRTKAILDSSSNTFLITLTQDMKVSSFNTHCLTYFSFILNQELKEGMRFEFFFETTVNPARMRLFRRYFREVKRGKSRQFEVMMEAKAGEYWLEIFMNPIYDMEGNISEISIVAHDISEKKKTSIEIEESLREKEVLLKEIHHRVKNNLQVISSILNLQSSFVEDEKTLEILQESRNRIRSMAIIHENLYRTEDFSSIHFSSYLDNLAHNLVSSYRIGNTVHLRTQLDEVDLILDQAIPCGLLVNELITNSLKYAWKDGTEGTITIALKNEDRQVELEIGDDGIGLPLEFEQMNSDTLGLQLVLTLVEQLDGEISVDISNGTKYLIKFENTKP